VSGILPAHPRSMQHGGYRLIGDRPIIRPEMWPVRSITTVVGV
jgi:hypothetical protein